MKEELIREAVDGYVGAFQSRDKAGFLNLLAPDVRQEDPVGSAPNIGVPALAAFWDQLFASVSKVDFGIRDLIVSGDEAALVFHITQHTADGVVDVDGIDIFQVDESGKITSIKGYSDAGHIAGPGPGTGRGTS